MAFKIGSDTVITDAPYDGEFSGGVDLNVYTLSQIASKSGSSGDIIYVSDSATKLVHYNGTTGSWVAPNSYSTIYGVPLIRNDDDINHASDEVFTDGDTRTGILLIDSDATTANNPTLEIEFPSTRSISKMVYGPWASNFSGTSGWGNKNYGINQLQYWTGSAWSTISTSPTNGSQAWNITKTYTFSSVSTNKVRVLNTVNQGTQNIKYLLIADLYFE